MLQVANRKLASARFRSAFPIILKDHPTDKKYFIAKKVMGTQPNVLRLILKNERDITVPQLERFIKTYHLNKDYFLTEEEKELPSAPLYTQAPSKVEVDMPVTMEKKSVGGIYKKIREQCGMTQGEMGRIVGRTQTQWSQIETGIISPQDDVKKALHEKLGISYNFMFTGEGSIKETDKKFKFHESDSDIKEFVEQAIVQVNQAIQSISNRDNSKLYLITESSDIHFQ